MDPDSPLSRVERTLWTVWAYITGAVNRFLRPQPANDGYNDPNSFQESAVDCEPADCFPAEGDAGRGRVDEEQPPAAAAQLSSSRPVVVWELSPTDIHMEADEESVRYQTQSSRSSEKEESTDGEEQISQTHDAENANVKEDKQEKREIGEFGSRDEAPEGDKQHVDASQILIDDGMREDIQKSEGKVDDKEEAMATDEHQEINETVTKTHVQEEECKMRDEGEQDLKAGEVKLCSMMDSSPEEEDEMLREEEDMQKDDAASEVTEEKAETCDDALQQVTETKSDEGTEQEENRVIICEVVSEVLDDELTAVGQENMTVGRRESYTSEDEGVKEDEQEEQNTEATLNQTTDEEPEQEKNITTVTDDSQEENILTEYEKAMHNTETWLQLSELTDIEQEDVSVTEVQSKTRDVATICVSLDDKDQAEEERLSSEVGNKDVEVECTSTSVTVKPEGETGQEMSGELGNTPTRINEGQVVVSQQLNSPTCEETQEGVPGYNNELGPDENTTRRFLEVGDYEETRTTWLPEEVESTEQESLQNSGGSTGADLLALKEPMEEKQEGTEGVKNSLDTGIQQFTDIGLTQEAEKPRAEPLESGHLFEGEEEKLLESSMKTEIKHTGLSEELLIDFGIDGGFCESKEADAGRAVAADGAVRFADEISEFLQTEVQKMTETSFSQESVLDVQTEQNSSRTPSLLEDTYEFGFLRPLVEIEPGLLDDSSLEVIDAEIILDEIEYGEKEEEAEDDTHLQEAGAAAELITEVKEKVNNVITESVLSQSPDRELEISEEEMITEAADELKATEVKPKDLSADEKAEHVRESDCSHTEETSDSISGHQDVIDEEILDLWIETAMSADTDEIKSEPKQQIDTERDPLNEKQGNITSEEDKEQLMEPNSGESGLASDAEMSLSTVESGLFNQSISEWDAQNSENQPSKSASTGSLHGIQDTLVSASESADISEFSPNSESKDRLIEETAERVQFYVKEEMGFYSNSPEERNLNQETDESQEKTDEKRVEATSTSQTEIDVEVTKQAEKTDWKDNEDVDVTSLTKVSTFFQIEETKFENEPLEISVSDSAREIKQTESRSGSEASLEEEIVSIEPDSQSETWTQKRLLTLPSPDQHDWSETESLSELERAEEAEEPVTMSDAQDKVFAPALDFTVQRSRIAVKNPRVRPPKDPRSLLHMPSVDPTPATHGPVKAPKGVPLGGLGIGIKLPGLGAGFPVLKKTQRVVKEENSQESLSQEPEVKPEEKSDAPQQDEAQHKPKWMPPRHPGFGNPLMSELKTKLRKTTQESE
ncbi:titin homolog isoform X2 [Acanthochromis polyacanthus]|uniref:titin homolog isoform X2 n=1 Tax=Acanthochromis polyacanthus TaxID=80966 RepID=UPI002234314A|nr:titin homolog isoform X2 [Acanthochromis polyacanthus]